MTFANYCCIGVLVSCFVMCWLASDGVAAVDFPMVPIVFLVVAMAWPVFTFLTLVTVVACCLKRVVERRR